MDDPLSQQALAKQNTYGQAIRERLASMLMSTPPNPMSRAYQMHVAEAQALGQQPMNPQEFQARQQ